MANLIQLWLTRFDHGELTGEEAEASGIAADAARIATLERKVGQFTMELELAKKNTADAGHEQQRQTLRHQRPRACSIRRGCKAMNLPRSTYYYRTAAKAEGLTDAELTAIIEDIQDELPCYGYRRVTHELRRRGLVINHKRIARVMRGAGLGIKPRSRFVRTTHSRHDSPIFPNFYCDIIPDRPDRVWVADFTYIRVVAGFFYLAVILGACSRKVIGYALSRRLNTPLVLAALRSTVANRTPPEGCLHHTDRGCRYACQTYRDALHAAGLRGSIGSVGNPYHTARAESSIKTLKVEAVYRAEYETFADVAARLPMFIEQVYNAKRLHSALGYRTPEEFETLFAQEAA